MTNLISLCEHKLRFKGKYKQFTSNYNSRVVIYDRKICIRLATGTVAYALDTKFGVAAEVGFVTSFPLPESRIFAGSTLFLRVRSFVPDPANHPNSKIRRSVSLTLNKLWHILLLLKLDKQTHRRLVVEVCIQ